MQRKCSRQTSEKSVSAESMDPARDVDLAAKETAWLLEQLVCWGTLAEL